MSTRGERDQCAEATRLSLFSAVGEPIVRVTGGANTGKFNLPHACPFEKVLIRPPQVKVDSFIV